jgi:hypothetical protein
MLDERRHLLDGRNLDGQGLRLVHRYALIIGKPL